MNKVCSFFMVIGLTTKARRDDGPLLLIFFSQFCLYLLGVKKSLP